MGTVHLLRLLSFFTGISMLQQVRSWIISVPTTVTAVEGSCVVVPCQTQPHSRVTWYRYHSIHYPVVYDERLTTVEDQFRGRTSVLGEAAEGNCTLTINNMKIADNKLRVYVWINPDSKPAQKFHLQTITIFVERKAPIISIQERILDGEVFQANCSIKLYSCPFSSPSLHWNISPFPKNYTSVTFNENVQGQRSYTQTLQGLATYEMHNRKMWCSAKFGTFTTESRQITLNILYDPVTVTLILGKEPIMEGGSITIECAANCNPQPHRYIWWKRQMGQKNEITSSEKKKLFNNITRGTSLSCIAHNDIGTGKSAWLDLDVQYAPVILPESSCHLTEEVVQCVCRAEASPNASIYWTIDGKDTPPSSFNILSKNNKTMVTGEMKGPVPSQSNISCTATNSLGSDTKQLSVKFSEKSYTWLSALILPGIGLPFGCAVFIYRKYFRNRQPPSVVCTGVLLRSHDVSDDVPQEQRYSSLQSGSQDEGTQSSSCRLESDPEVISPSCVYDNDFVEDMRGTTRVQQHQNNATAPQREDEIQPEAKALRNIETACLVSQPEDCSMDAVYLNCGSEDIYSNMVRSRQ